MLEQVNTPQVEVLQGVMDATKDTINSFYKDSDNLPKNQLLDAKKITIQHLGCYVGTSIQKVGELALRIEPRIEADIIDLFEQGIIGRDGDNIPHYFYADSRNSVRVYNGRYFEHMTSEAFEMIFKRVLADAEVGKVYRLSTPKKIADEILKELWYGEFRWEPDSRYFVFKNGVLDVEELILKPFSEAYQTNNVFDVDFNPDAKCPLFQQCLDDALGKDEQKVLQEMCGYLLFPDFRHEKIGVLVGNGRNGKSAILDAISYALGERRVTHYSLQHMTSEKGLYIANSIGAIANISNDSGNVIKVGNEAIFKQYVSGEPLMAKVLREQPTETTAYPKSIIAVNELPQSADFSSGFYRRFLIIEFEKQIPIEKVDKQLDKKLQKEQVGILLWILEGYKRLMQQGDFTECESVNNIQNRYREESDPVIMFLKESNYQKSSDDKDKILLSILFADFKEWLIRGNYQPMSIRKFASRLRNNSYKVINSSGNQVNVWIKKVIPTKTDDGEEIPF